MSRLQSHICPIIIGRDTELAHGTDLLSAANDGNGEMLFISGEAGIGKSRLIRSLIETATWRGVQHLIANCQEYDRDYPYAPFLDGLRHLVHRSGPEALSGLPPTDRTVLARLLPELADDVPPPDPLPPAHAQRRIFEAFVRLFTYLAHDAPLLIVIEDIHWADATSLELLHLLARRLRMVRTLIVVTARSDEPGGSLDHWLGGLQRNRLVTEQRLTPLAEPDVAKMIDATLDTPLAMPVVAAINRRAEGNPFFIEELLHALIEKGERSGQADEDDAIWERYIPAPLAETVTRRLDTLDARARDVATVASVIGRSFSYDLLRALTDLDEIALTDTLRQLIVAHLVVEVRTDHEWRFAFRHALTRDAIYARLLGPELRRLHHQVAQAFASETNVWSRPSDGELGQHYFMAEQWSAALEYCQRAGEEAQALHAPRAAIEHLSRAVVAAGRVGAPRTDILLQRGQAFAWIGDFDCAREDYEAVLTDARAIGDHAMEGRTLLELSALWSTRNHELGLTLCEEALALARATGDTAMGARALNLLGNHYFFADRPFEARSYLEQALALFESLNDAEGIAQSLTQLGSACYLGADLAQGATHHRRAVEVAQTLGDSGMLVLCLAGMTQRGATLQGDWMVPEVTRILDALPEGEQALATAQRIGWRMGETWSLSCLAFSVAAVGDYARAFRWAEQAREIADEIEHRGVQFIAHGAVGLLYLELLAVPVAIQHLERAVTYARDIGSSHYIETAIGFMVTAYLANDDLARAEALLRESLLPNAPARTFGQRRIWLARAELALAQGDPGLALRIGDDLIMSAPNIATLDGRGIPRIDLLRGEALAALGRYAETEPTLRIATETARAQGALPLLWRVHRAAGNCFQKMKRTTDAAREFGAAMRIIEELAAHVPDDHTRGTFARHAHASLPRAYVQADRRAAKQQFSGLTAREREVVARIASGETNRAIAEALFITEKTVELHVTNSLRKLGYRGRVELAAWAIESGLAQSTIASRERTIGS